MKKLITILTLTMSFSLFAADKCHKETFKKFLKSTSEYEYHTLSDAGTKFEAEIQSFVSYGVTIKLGYNFPVISYQASNEYYSGYGAYEIIVNPMNCKILDMVEVYAE